MMWCMLKRRGSTNTTPNRTDGRMIMDVAMDMDAPIAGSIADGKFPTTKVVGLSFCMLDLRRLVLSLIAILCLRLKTTTIAK